MGLIQVTAAELRKKAEELKELNMRFQSQVEALTNCEQALKTMWEGQANDTFHGAYVRDQGQMERFYNAIEQYIAALFIIAAKYEEAEARNTATASTRSY